MKRLTSRLAVMVMFWFLLAAAVPDRLRRVARDERGDAGGKGLIILVAAVLGLAAVVAVGVLITKQINSRGNGLNP